MPQTVLLRCKCDRRSSMRAKRGMPQATKSLGSWRIRSTSDFRNGWESQVEIDFSHFETKEERFLSNGALLALSSGQKSQVLAFWHASCVHLC